MRLLHDIVHTTVYRYAEPVRFGVHRVMFRPRDSHDQRVLATDLEVSPDASVRMIQDPYSNSIALVQPLEPSAELRIVCSFTIELVPSTEIVAPLSRMAAFVPFAYDPRERFDLEHYLRPHHEDPDGVFTAWVHRFLTAAGPADTLEVLSRINRHIGATLRYQTRDEEGTQAPLQTLELGSGSCRDFALLMMEAARRLGIAARFVSGYLYDAALDAGGTAMTGAGATHAWMQVYLPGAGWVTYDPTNNLIGDAQLIRVAVVRDPSLAAPISGTWYGETQAYLGMQASVTVRRRGEDPSAVAPAPQPQPLSAPAVPDADADGEEA